VTRPRREHLALAFSWIAGVAGAAWVTGTMLRADRIGGADAPHLVSTELRLAHLVLDGEAGLALRLAWDQVAPHPPFGALPGWIVALVSGGSPGSAPVTMGLLLLVGFDALVRLARRITGGPTAAVAAWATLLGSPFLWSSVEQHSRDLLAGVAALQALSWAAAEGGLAVRRNAVGFGLGVAAAFGVKYTGPVFLVGGCGVVGAALLWRRDTAAWKGLGLALALFAATAGAWYATHHSGIAGYLQSSLDPAAMRGNSASLRDTGSREAMLYYPATLWDAMSAPGVALVLLSALLGLARRDSRLPTAMIAASAGVGLLVLTRVSQQVDRYALPGLFLAAALVLPLARWRVGLVVGLALAGPRLLATSARFAPGAPTAPEAFAHQTSTFSAPQYPIAPEPWKPSDFDAHAWNLDGVVAALRRAQGDSGTVGLISLPQPGWPTFGHLAIAAAGAGARWDWGTVNLRTVTAYSPPVFLGPLFADDWPSPEFRYLVSLDNGGDPGVRAWMQRHPLTEAARVEKPRGGAVMIYRVGD
jgi:hypothetical protein